MGSLTACDSCLCTQPRPKWERFPRICDSPKYFSGRSIGCSAPRSSASGAGFARNSQCAIGRSRSRPEEVAKHASQDRARNPRRGLPSSRAKVLSAAFESNHRSSDRAKENWFRDVKIFSHLSSCTPCQKVDLRLLFYLPLPSI